MQKFRRRNMVSYFANNATKNCSYGLKISKNIEMKNVYYFKAYVLPLK